LPPAPPRDRVPMTDTPDSTFSYRLRVTRIVL
jgi:hypothetical protein